MLKSYKIYTCTNGTLGLHLSRAPWDPYPWVSSIQKESTSYQAGLRIGDCLLELNGQDVLGMKISEIAALLKNHWLNESSNYVTVVIWRNKCNSSKKHSNNVNNNEDATTDVCNEEDFDDDDDDEDEENNAHNINQQSLQKFATCLQHIAQLLECPVCLEVIKPPGWQCCNGHVLCNNCRSRSEKCPVCRVPLGPRGRCLLSDKLFTLLADSFPCDGVRSNKNSPKDRRKCSTEFHNQPKMAIIQKQQERQQEKDELQQLATKKAKDFLLTSLRQRRRKISFTKITQNNDNSECIQRTGVVKKQEEQEEQQHLSIQKQAMYDTNNVVVVTSSINNRKSSLDYTRLQQAAGLNVIEGVATSRSSSVRYNELFEHTTTIQQCYCITCCYKPDKIAIVNNVATATTTTTPAIRPQNKYILRISSQEQQEKNILLHQQPNKEKYKNYQCPTGKLCCLNKNTMPHEATMIKNINKENFNPFYMAHNLSSENNFPKTLKNEWEILAHLTEDHKLPVQQYYALYGQRIHLHYLSQQNAITCLNLKSSNEPESKIEKFFIVCMPLEMTSNTNATATKVALYVYHMNTLTNNNATTTKTSPITTTSLDNNDDNVDVSDGDFVVVDDEVSNFETIIENPLTGIKWFGQAHPLTTPWSHIFEKQHFLEHNVTTTHQSCAAQITADNSIGSGSGSGVGNGIIAGGSSGNDAFVIVVKRKLEMKTKI